MKIPLVSAVAILVAAASLPTKAGIIAQVPVISDQIRLCDKTATEVCGATSVLMDADTNPAIRTITEDGGADLPTSVEIPMVVGLPPAFTKASSVYILDSPSVISDIVTFEPVSPKKGDTEQKVNITLRSDSGNDLGKLPAGSKTVVEKNQFINLTPFLFPATDGEPAAPFTVWVYSDVNTPEPSTGIVAAGAILLAFFARVGRCHALPKRKL